MNDSSNLQLSTTIMSSSSEHQVKNEFKHFLHKHPLMLCEDGKASDLEEKECCICYDSILDGPTYTCKECNFSIHKQCGELPQKIRNMLHPEHLLELSYSRQFLCNACNGRSYSSSYRCNKCDFDLHFECAVPNTFEEPQGHRVHTFNFIKPTLFTCDGCGLDNKTKCISSICATCQLQVHKNCVYSFPFAINQRRHNHALSLTYSFQMDSNFVHKRCKICFYKMNNVLCMYCCAECDYFTHVSCGASTNIVDEIGNEESDHNTLELKEAQPRQQVEHFSHQHSLTLNIDELKCVIDEPNCAVVCDGCIRPISIPFYACEECNFLLHQRCVELPKKIQHPLHDHELVLVATWDLDCINWKFGVRCYGCGNLCNGFVYKCPECQFFLDIGCSSLPDTLRHEGHACPLMLVDMNLRGSDNFMRTNCAACGEICLNKFTCEECKFDLDLRCASMPKEIGHKCPKHDWNTHPFKLMYCAIEDAAGQYYCNACEEERNKNHWFYYCEDCDYFSHPRCLLGDDLIKYGKLYKFNNHPHPLRHLKNINKIYKKHTCMACTDPFRKEEEVFSCEECDVYYHNFGDCCVISEPLSLYLHDDGQAMKPRAERADTPDPGH